jgi:hypothetical protein
VTEIKRLREKIRHISSPQDLKTNSSDTSNTDLQNKDSRNTLEYKNPYNEVDGFQKDIPSPTDSTNPSLENSKTSTVLDIADPNSKTTKQEVTDNITTAVSTETQPQNQSEMKAEIRNFKGLYEPTKGAYVFSYFIVNITPNNIPLEGKAIVLLNSDTKIYPYPWIPVANGVPEIGTRGILFKIQRQKEMTGEISASLVQGTNKTFTVILNNRAGTEIVRNTFEITE